MPRYFYSGDIAKNDNRNSKKTLISMKLYRFSLLLIAAILITSSCSNLVGNSERSSAIEWQKGEDIVQANDDHLSEEQQELYLEDAEKLSVRYINEKDPTQTEIPQQLIDLLYNGLIHIENSDNPEAEEVTEVEVHARLPYHPRQIEVKVNTSAPWIDAWQNGTTNTEYDRVDELIDQFDFTLVDFLELKSSPNISFATLRSDRALNVYAVGRLFEDLDYIERAGPSEISGDGSDIGVLFFEDFLRFTFEYRFGDCPAGCIGSHTWHFRVYRDGTVDFESESGDPLPN